MPEWNRQPGPFGALVAFVVLILAIGVMAFDLHHVEWRLSLIAALAVARLT